MTEGKTAKCDVKRDNPLVTPGALEYEIKNNGCY